MLKKQLIKKLHVQYIGQLASIILKTQNFTKNRVFYAQGDIDGEKVMCYFIVEITKRICDTNKKNTEYEGK